MNENLAVLALLAPFLATLLAVVPLRNAELSAQAAATLTGLGFVALAGLAVTSLRQDPVRLIAGIPALQVELDPLAILMLLVVLGLSFLTQSFAVRYLRGDQRQRWFVATANGLTAVTAVMVGASTVLLFVCAWVASGFALLLLLSTYRHEPQARDGIRKTALSLAIGDAALIAGVAVLSANVGWQAHLADVGRAISGLSAPAATLVGLLLLAPALARSSQIPFHAWLPATLATPTPVSALMHAGVVNAGAILIIRFAPALEQTPFALSVIFTAGAVTLVYAAALRMTKSDVKGRLVFSTMAQMGFMMMACGLGAYAAAVFHLVAHGLFKSFLFLSAGGAVARAALERSWPTARALRDRAHVLLVVAAIALSLAAVAVSRALFWPEISGSSAALLVFVVIAASATLGGAFASHPSPGFLLAGGVTVAVFALSYTLALRRVSALLGDSVSPPGAVSPWWVALPGLLLLLAGMLPRLAHRPSAARDALYAHALATATPRVFTLKGN